VWGVTERELSYRAIDIETERGKEDSSRKRGDLKRS
jgi:hypothetical protein